MTKIHIATPRWIVCEPVVTDEVGNICVNPQDQMGRMYVRASLVRVIPKDTST